MLQWITIALSFLLLLGSSAVSAQTVDPAIRVIMGVVVRQVHGCEMDGRCSVVVKTDSGEESVTWNKGEAMPPAVCNTPNDDAAREASFLQPGDKVEIHIRQDTGGMLCGPGAAIIRLP